MLNTTHKYWNNKEVVKRDMREKEIVKMLERIESGPLDAQSKFLFGMVLDGVKRQVRINTLMNMFCVGLAGGFFAGLFIGLMYAW